MSAAAAALMVEPMGLNTHQLCVKPTRPHNAQSVIREA